MAVLNKADLLAKVGKIVGDNTSDDALSLLEDLSETYDDLEKKTGGESEWKTKYEENDKMWRQKYRDRFLQATPKEDEEKPEEPEQDNTPKLKTTFEELFTNE